MPVQRRRKPSKQKQVLPGAGKAVVTLVMEVLGGQSDAGLVALLTDSSLIVGKPSQSETMTELLERAFDSAVKVYKERGVEEPLLTGGATIHLDKVEVRPFSAWPAAIRFDSLTIFASDVVAIAPATSYDVSNS